MFRLVPFLLFSFAVACSDDAPPVETPDMSDMPDVTTPDMETDTPDMAVDGVSAIFAPDQEGFFRVPFPSDLRVKEDGSHGFAEFETLKANRVGGLWIDAAEDLKTGWGLVSGVFFWFDGPINAQNLPNGTSVSLDPLPLVALIDVDAASPQFKKVFPLECKYTLEPGTYHPGNMLACLSPYGVLRRANTRYAAVVLSAEDVDGNPIARPEALSKLLTGDSPNSAAYTESLAVLEDMGIDAEQITTMTVFTTHDPTARHRQIYDFYKDLPEPVLDDTKPVEVMRTYDTHIVVSAHYKVPNIQQGPLPFDVPPAGKIIFGQDGQPVIQYEESIRILLTIPRIPMAADGFPVLFYMHGSGGAAMELLDRGSRTGLGQDEEVDKGPGTVIAPYGIAGFAADFALHDSRYPMNPDTTGLLLYNLLGNPRAMVDNFIVAANEVSLHARLMKNLELPVANLAPLDPTHFPDGVVKFNGNAFTSMGHSMGSTIGTPAMTLSNEYQSYIASGAGGLYMEVALETQDPVVLKPLLKSLLRMKATESLDRFDLVLNTLQHVFDYADATVHSPHVQARPHPGVEPKHIYQPVGLQDRYFSAASRASLTTGFEIPIGGEVLEPVAFDYMRWVGQDTPITLPVSLNRTINQKQVTGVAVQFQPAYEGGGHYITFDLDDAKAIYGCYLKTLVTGAPEIRSAANASVANCL